MGKIAEGCAPGKVILFGEHAVVYGQPAVAASLSLTLRVRIQEAESGVCVDIPGWLPAPLMLSEHPSEALAIALNALLNAFGLNSSMPLLVEVEGDLPLGAGLGSSASLAVAFTRALAQFKGVSLPDAELLRIAGEAERAFHGHPSGLDHTTIVRQTCIRFQQGTAPQEIHVSQKLPLVIGWARREPGGSRRVISELRARMSRYPELYEPLFKAMGQISDDGAQTLVKGDWERLGTLFDLAHGYLAALGVSNLDNERMISIARRAGALGAKLTGAGAGGAVIAVVREEQAPEIAQSLREAGYGALVSSIASHSLSVSDQKSASF